MIVLQNLITTNHRRSAKSKYDRILLRFRVELGHAWFERVCFSCETCALLCGNCHVSKGKLFSLVNSHTAIYVLKRLPLGTWQFPHSNAYVSHEKHIHVRVTGVQAQSETVVIELNVVTKRIRWYHVNRVRVVRLFVAKPAQQFGHVMCVYDFENNQIPKKWIMILNLHGMTEQWVWVFVECQMSRIKNHCWLKLKTFTSRQFDKIKHKTYSE